MARTAAVCHPEKPVKARGLCATCYMKWKYHNDPIHAEKTKAKSRQYRLDHPDEHVAYNKAYWARNREKGAEQSRRWNAAHPDYSRRRHWAKNYNLTPEQYQQILDSQGGVCAICSQVNTYSRYQLSVDHCHDTGRIRGLLCDKCNRGIGLLGDDTALLAQAIKYLTTVQ
jgi:hypothetical protein